ncbi:hypothetical protein [Agrobacterium sp. NPDC089420]|uniref:hypothetical protein n=1 Tax=Agrobacterium sp. NPDC089420 TaxID=3363918 RepID=UPI00384D0FFB
MKFFLTDGFRHHHIQSRNGSPPAHRTQKCIAIFGKIRRFGKNEERHRLLRLRHESRSNENSTVSRGEPRRFKTRQFRRSAYGLPKMYVNARKAAKPASARKVTPQQDF